MTERFSRCLHGFVATGLALAVVTAPATPAAAERKPLKVEWWFNAWQVQEKLWSHGRGKGVTVAVIDSGVDASAPDLKGAILPGADFSGAGGKGWVDHDVHVAGHGTAMAALIVSQGTGTGMLGIAPEARVLPIATSFKTFAGQKADIDAIRYATDHGADVINMSIGEPSAQEYCDTDLQAVVAYAIEHDVVIVAAAGNDGTFDHEWPSTPGNCAGVMTVGAVDQRLRLYSKSEPHDYLMLAAPGVKITSVHRGGHLRLTNGTSDSAALISGVVALLRSAFPDLSGREIVRRLLSPMVMKDVGKPGFDHYAGYGVPIPSILMDGKVPPPGPNPVYDRYDKWKSAQAAVPTPQPESANPHSVTPSPTAVGKPKSSAAPVNWTTISLAAGLLLLAVVIGGILFSRRRRPAPGPHQ